MTLLSSSYLDIFHHRIQSLKEEGRYRYFVDLERLKGRFPYALWYPSSADSLAAASTAPLPREVVIWCSNDYLGMSHHPDVYEAFSETAERLGVGSGGTRNISGTAHPHILLEKEIASLHGKERGLLFSSGYAANEAALSSLSAALEGCVVLSDEKNHASMIQGIRSSACEKRIFKHNDLKELKFQLKLLPKNQPKIIAFVSVYSMEGDIAPIKDICDLAEEYNAVTYLDEVHAVGIYGKDGAGVAAEKGLSDRLTLIQGNFAKAYGVVGGYITGPDVLVDYVRCAASGFIFTTSLPPAVASAALASVQFLKKDQELRKTLWENVAFLKEELEKTNIPYLKGESHIVPVMVCDATRCRQVSQILLEEYGLYVQPINYPTVPRGLERLRLTITPFHSKTMVSTLVEALQEVWARLDLKKAA